MLWHTTQHSSYLWTETMVVIYFCPCINSVHNHLNRPWKIPDLCGTKKWCRVLPEEIQQILSHANPFWHTAHLLSNQLEHNNYRTRSWASMKGKGEIQNNNKGEEGKRLHTCWLLLVFFSVDDSPISPILFRNIYFPFNYDLISWKS